MRTKSMIVLGAGIAAVIGIGWTNATPKTPVDSIAESFASYEKIRRSLVADQVEGLSKVAERLAKIAGSGPRLEAVAKAADQLVGAKDIRKARLLFGDLSREFITILRADPNLARGRFVYQCPMVKEGYGKWIQTEKEISNPYMGKEMLRCGVASDTRE